MQLKKPEIFESFRNSRRKVREATRRVCGWFNREFRASEPLPKEFKEFDPQEEVEKNRARSLWQKHF